MSRTMAPEYGGARDEVQDSVGYFHSCSRAVQTQRLHVPSSSTQPAAKVARGLSPINLSVEGCVCLEIDMLSALQLLDEGHGMSLTGRQTLYQL